MKNVTIFALLLVFAMTANAQQKAATLKKDGPVIKRSTNTMTKMRHAETGRTSGRLGEYELGMAKKIKESGITQSTIHDIDVIAKPSTKQVVSLRMYIRGGTANFPKQQEGIEALTMAMLTEGLTTKYSKEEYFGKLESTGTSLSADNQYDYSSMNLKCLKSDWDTAIDLFDAAVFYPDFREQDFERIRNQMIAAAQQSSADPDVFLRNAAMQHTFDGMNYAKLMEGTEESLKALSLQDVKDYYAKIIAKNKLFFVLVGDVETADLERQLGPSLSRLEPFIDRGQNEQAMSLSKNEYKILEREFETNYIRGYMMAPPVGSADEYALRLGMSILSERLFLEVRTKRNLSYAPNAFYPTSVIGNPYLAVYVTTIEPDTTIKVIKQEIEKLRTRGFTDKEVLDKKGGWLTMHYMNQETNDAQASSLGLAHMASSWEKSLTMPEKVQALTAADLTKAFKKYTDYISWTYVGIKDDVDPKVLLAP